MEEYKKVYQKLVEQLQYSKEILEKSANRVHDNPMKEKFHSMAMQRDFYKKEIQRLFDIKQDNLTISKSLQASLDKMWIDTNHAYLRLNEGETTDVVLKAEKQLAEMYESIIMEVTERPMIANILRIQLADFNKGLRELTDIREQYKFA